MVKKLIKHELIALFRIVYIPAVAAVALDIPAKLVDPAEGLFYACLQNGGRRTGAEKLAALYLRRSSAEENAK